MYPKKTLFLLYICSALLFMQMSGIHIHINLKSSGEPVTHNLNLFDLNDHNSAHDHESNIDVDIFELSTTWSKIFQFFIVTVFLMLALIRLGKYAWSPPSLPFNTRHKHFWRPVLRAPPTLL
jgi:hypothetical protein